MDDHATSHAVVMTTLGTLHPRGAAALARYAAVVMPLIRAAGGEVVGRAVTREVLVGGDAPGFVAVIRFPDAAHARAMIASAAYRAAVPDRDEAFLEIRTFLGDSL